MREAGALHVDTELTVPFHDVDAMDVVWHGHYVKYLGVARCALLEHIGHDYRAMKAAGYFWPIIDLQLRYVQAARFGQRLIVRADLLEWQNRLKIAYLITDAEHGACLTRASTVQIAVRISDGAMQLASPTVFTHAVERALAQP